LELLQPSHSEALLEAAGESEWTWMPTVLDSKRSVDGWISETLQAQSRGLEYPFVVKHRGKIVGSTRYMDVREKDKGAEIGWTWYTKSVWGHRCQS